MASKKLSPNPTELIDWLNGEGLLELDWDFPDDGDLFAAGLDSNTATLIVSAIHDEYDIEFEEKDLLNAKVMTPQILTKMIESRLG